jgi:hypothetical protein
MLKASAQRFRWYLGLRHILDWPKYFVAPIKSFRFRHGRATEQSGESTTFVPPLSARSVIWAQTRHVGTGTADAGRRTGSTFSGPFLLAMRGLRRDASIERAVTSQRLTSSIGQPSLKPQTHALAAFYRLRYHDQLGNAPLNTPNRWLTGSVAHLPVGANIPSLAPVQGPSRHGDRHDGGYERPARLASAATAAAIESSEGQEHYEQPLIRKSFQDNSGTFLPDETATAIGTAVRPGLPAVSTIHIDGSALGRWAVQYLERALGKPATGMTGVDPRASRPRYRVSPF